MDRRLLFAAVLVATGCTREPDRAPITKTPPTESIDAAPAAAPAGVAIAPDGPPDCNVVMTIPLAPTVTAKAGAGGVVHVILASYSQVPLATSVTTTATTIAISATPAGPASTFCYVPLKVTGVVAGTYDVVVSIAHPGRPVQVLKTKVTVP